VLLTVVVSMGVFTMLPMHLAGDSSGRTPVTLQSVWEGARFYLMTPMLAGLGALDLGVTLFTSFRPITPILAEEVLNVGPAGLGLLLSAPSAGSLAGATAVTLLANYRHRGQLIFYTTFAYGLLTIPLGYSQVFLLTLAIVVGLGFLDSMGATTRATNVQLYTPDHLRGRVTSMHLTVAGGGTSLGNAEIGIMASLIGIGHALALGGVLCMLTVLAVALWWRQKPPSEQLVAVGAPVAGAAGSKQ
jgi:sugar phosphate permease